MHPAANEHVTSQQPFNCLNIAAITDLNRLDTLSEVKCQIFDNLDIATVDSYHIFTLLGGNSINQVDPNLFSFCLNNNQIFMI
jgi:hypothetical protein